MVLIEAHARAPRSTEQTKNSKMEAPREWKDSRQKNGRKDEQQEPARWLCNSAIAVWGV